MSALLLLLLAATPDPRVIAEILPSAEGSAALHALDAQAQSTVGSPRVLLWRLSADRAADVLAALEAKLPGHFAPVIVEGAKLRVPAGGVLVWLKSAPDAAAFVDAHRLVVQRDFGAGTLLVESLPGAQTLALSSALLRDERVKTASPNWWLRGVRR